MFSPRIVLVSIVVSSPAAADDRVEPPFHSPDWHLVPSLVAGVEHFHYAEGDQQPAVILNQHTAVLPTARLSVELTSPFSRFYARASFGAKGGSMTYEGARMDGTPVSGPTTGGMTDLEAIAGGRGRIAKHAWLGGYLGLGHHTWTRDLRPVGAGGYLEDYSWGYVPVGIVLDLAASQRLTFTIDASLQLAVQSFGTNLHVSAFPLDATTTADAMDVRLAADSGTRLRASGAYAISRELRLIAAAGLESFQIDDGPLTQVTVMGQPLTDPSGQPIGLGEPFSKTTRYTFDVGASYTF